jgi:AbiV family abortive infection protein
LKETFKQIAQKSIENAEELFMDAHLLDSYNRKERAYTLYQLSIEEVGKAIEALLFILNENYKSEDEVRRFKTQFFKKHQKKTLKSRGVDIMIAEVVSKGNKEIALNILKESIEAENTIQEIDDFKNYSLYTSIINESEVKKPSDLITKERLDKIREISKNRVGAAKAFVFTGLENLEELLNYKKENPLGEIDIDVYAKEFWEKFKE